MPIRLKLQMVRISPENAIITIMISQKNPDTLSDVELVKLTLGDQENFLYLVNRYKDRLIHYVRRLTNANIEEAEDTMQEVFLKVYLNLNDFNPNLKFSSWIYRITHNQVISRHRKIKARPEGYSIDIEDQAARSLAADVDIIDATDLVIMKEQITAILSELPDKYREVLVLKFLEEKNYQEMSDIIKKPVGTVASTLNKAKQEFKKEMIKQKFTFNI
jgi:RNA polymerase sigma-70 factor (ECF subfamily)